ncbi:HpcH/HpaI aldolase family protein [Halomicrobium salinisoli]|uniref:HpcH/HpaI aldolase family protein n=1 Tax=Halomicrobium salinisoli TaxID=2878391 RepID=UPI001CF00A1D|nr:aldolase/citrate lyase family protein [Halomicrobium salinisoli]
MADSQRTNDLRETLEAGDVALGVLDNTYSPSLVEMYGDLGADFVWIDLEHGGPSPWDAPAMENLLRAAEVTGTELLVRLPEPDQGLVRKALDAGVRTAFISQVQGPEDVREAIEASQFTYAEDEPGRRGMAAPRARRWGMAEDYPETEDEEVMIGVTIENESALNSIDEILEVPELGFVFLGPLDLSVSLGHPGEVDHPEVQEAVEEVREKAQAADVPVGGLGFGPDDVSAKADAGYQLINMGSTMGALQGAVKEWLAEIET